MTFVTFFAFAASSVFAQPEKNPTPVKKAKSPWIINLSTTLGLEHESNIFLAEDNEDSDIKSLVSQDISLKLPKDKLYCEFDFNYDLAYYHAEGDTAQTIATKALINTQPTDNLSFGFKNLFTYAPSSKIITTVGDRLLALGFVDNTSDFEGKWRFAGNTALGLGAQIYRLDVFDLDADDFIDRYAYTYGPTLYQDFRDDVSGYLSYRYQKIDFTQATQKSMRQNQGLVGLVKKFAGWFNATTEVSYQRFNMSNNLSNGPQRRTGDVGVSFTLDSTSSVYSKVVLGLFFNQVYPSSRSQYAKYRNNGVNLSLRHFLTPKLIILGNAGFERQNFDSDSALAGVTKDSLNAKVTSCGLTLERILNKWLNLDFAYKFTKRDSDFAQDGYKDNQITVSLKASY